MKKRITAVGLIAVLLVSLLSFSLAAEPDTSLQKWVTYGVLQGTDPHGAMTRSDLALALVALKGYEETGDRSYRDLREGTDGEEAMKKLAYAGILTGYEDGTMRPERPVTKEEAALCVVRAFGMFFEEELKTEASEQVSVWAKDAVGLILGNGYSAEVFDPKGTLTEQEFADFLDQLYPGTYHYFYLQTLEGGFIDTISDYAKARNWTVEQFNEVNERSAAQMTAEELEAMNHIRNKQLKPDPQRLMQKVITTYDMNQYLSGAYKTPKGFVSIAADVKQYRTVEDMYYGLRLDYEGTYFKPEEESYAVIRFKADNIEKAVIPKSPANGGDVEDPYPFGGAGFTTGTNGRFGSPEWVMPEFTVLQEGAELYEVYSDGTEVLRAVYHVDCGQFVEVKR